MPVVLKYTPTNNYEHKGDLELFVNEKVIAIIPIIR